MTYGLETEWDYSGRKGRDGQKKKIGKANEKRKKGEGKKRTKKLGNEWTRGKGGERGALAPTEEVNTTLVCRDVVSVSTSRSRDGLET